MNSRVEHTDVGAYALGLLEEPDRRAFEVHLARCSACAAELADLRGMRDLFAGLDPAEVAAPAPAPLPPPAPSGRVIDMMRHKRAAERARERRRRQSSMLLASAAVIGLLAGGIAVGSTVLDDGNGGPPIAQNSTPPSSAASTLALLREGDRRTATDPTTGATGIVAMEGKAWGTRVALDLGKVKGPLSCQLVAVGKTGEERVVVGWSVPDKGYGLPGSPDHLIIEGGVATPPSEIARFEVRIDGRGDLLTVPV